METEGYKATTPHEQREIRSVNILRFDDYEQMSQYSAEEIRNEIKRNPDLLLCTATGSTPTRTYELLVDLLKTELNLFNKLRIVKLDEWGGIAPNDPAACESYLQQKIIEPLSISSDRYISFESNPENPQEEAKKIAQRLKQEGGIDVCVLGIGLNGHLGFNEPTDQLIAHTHVATLAHTTMDHTMAQQSKGQIRYGLTLGMEDILNSGRIILLVNGLHKREVFERLVSTDNEDQFPASKLWGHPNVTIICDREAVPDIAALQT